MRGTFDEIGSYASGVSAEEGDELAKQPGYRLRLATQPYAPVEVKFETPKAAVTHVVVDHCPFGPGATNNTRQCHHDICAACTSENYNYLRRCCRSTEKSVSLHLKIGRNRFCQNWGY